jgi:hypothetical protein
MKKLKHPIRSISEPFGKAGLIVGIVALVFAMLGGAYAATGGSATRANSSANGRRGSRGPKGARGPVGPQGAEGPKGPKGDSGAPGKDGANGVDGKSVEVGAVASGCPAGGVSVQVAGDPSTKKEICNGEDGETGFTETLPPGKTETGSWAGAVYEVGPVAISFNIPLAAPIDESHTKVIPEGGTPPAECENPGHAGTASVENPEAKPGFLCIYVEITPESAVKEIEAPGTDIEGAGTTGTFVILETTSTFGEEHAKGRGTWAVTAP